MTIALAISNIVSSLSSLATVREELQEQGNVDYQLSISLGDLEEEFQFGATKSIQQINLELAASGTLSDGEIAAKCKAISAALIVDRRRGGYAQTTIAGSWTKSEDEGREGKIFESTIEVHIYEN